MVGAAAASVAVAAISKLLAVAVAMARDVVPFGSSGVYADSNMGSSHSSGPLPSVFFFLFFLDSVRSLAVIRSGLSEGSRRATVRFFRLVGAVLRVFLTDYFIVPSR